MNRSHCLVIALSLILLACKSQTEDKRPNILLILADDMGYSDLGCYGGEIQTPNLDQLAENGVRFTQFYNTARCCPTRTSLMTGLYPHEAGIGYMTHINAGPGYLGYLNDSCVTIPELLTDAGYFTGMTGKWHAGAVKSSWPENRGYQRFFGIHHWVDSYFKVLEDCEIYENGRMVIPASEHPYLYAKKGMEWYTTDVFTTKAIDYMEEAIDQDQPFFQYVAYNAPHWPLEAHDEVIQKYLESYQTGYEQLRKQKYKKMKEMGIIEENWDLPAQVTPDWNAFSDSVKEDLEFRRAIYAAQVDIMDRNIGRMVDFLASKGELNNTVIFFLSDNGCSAEPMGEDFGWKWGINTKWNYEQWRNNSAREGASQGRIWTVSSNSPFRKYKRFTHEGGISTPLIVHWPNNIKNPGSFDKKAGHVVDIMATCIDLAGTSYPEHRNGVPVLEMRGKSLVKNLLGEKGDEHDFLFWEHEGHGALRKGKWKLVSTDPSDANMWELYDMLEDRTETNNLANSYPERTRQMIDEWEMYAAKMKVIPRPDFSNSQPNPVDK